MKIVINVFCRPGSVLVDVYVYFMGLNSSARSDLCSWFETFTVLEGSDSLKIGFLGIDSFGK